MKVQFLFLFLFQILFQTTLQEKFDSIFKNCEIFGHRVTMGDYFVPNSPSTNMITIAANTKEKCKNIYLTLSTYDNKSHDIQPYINKSISGDQMTNGKIQYQSYAHFFNIPNSFVKEGDFFFYQIKIKGEQSNFQPEYEVQVPYKSKSNNNQLKEEIIIYGDYDANVQEYVKDNEKFNKGEYGHEYFMNLSDQNQDQRPWFLFLGDMGYDLISEGYVRSERFLQKVQPYYAQYVQVNTYGNHESGYQVEEFNYSYVEKMFKMPDYERKKNQNFAFDSMYAQFINYNGRFMNYNEDLEFQIDELEQLEQNLIQAQKRRYQKPWIIVFSHFPIYFQEKKQLYEDSMLGLVTQFEYLLNKYKVDLYITAHVHSYQRFHPVYNGNIGKFEKEFFGSSTKYINPDSTMHLIEGVAGQSHYFLEYIPTEREILAYTSLETGGGQLTIYNKTHLNYQHISYKSGEILDNFWIQKVGIGYDPSYLLKILAFIILLTIALMAGYIFVLKNNTNTDAVKTHVIINGKKKELDLKENENEEIELSNSDRRNENRLIVV